VPDPSILHEVLLVVRGFATEVDRPRWCPWKARFRKLDRPGDGKRNGRKPHLTTTVPSIRAAGKRYIQTRGRALKSTHTDDAHPGINISKIPVGGGIAGLMIAVSIVITGLIGLPPTRWFLGASLALGAVMALIRRWMARDRR
jgi:hypothetical protein